MRMRNEPESSADPGGECLDESVWDLLSGSSCWVSICASVDCFCTSKAEGSVIHRVTSREQAGCSLSRQTM